MRGGKHKQPLGYTIVEVMIVLAVSGVMFLIAASFINGKQAKTAFTTGTNEFNSVVQSTIDQVSAGQYSGISLHCTVAGNRVIIDNSVSPGQGGNSPCVFLGKFIHISLHSDPTGGAQYEVISLAGDRAATPQATPQATLDLAHATPITPINGLQPNSTELTIKQVVPQSLSINSIKVTVGGVSIGPVYGIGFVQSLGSLDSNGAYQSGAQTVNLVYVPNPPLGPSTDEQPAAQALIGNLKLADAATICLSDGTRYAVVELGAGNNASQLSADLQVVTACP